MSYIKLKCTIFCRFFVEMWWPIFSPTNRKLKYEKDNDHCIKELIIAICKKRRFLKNVDFILKTVKKVSTINRRVYVSSIEARENIYT